MNNDHDILNYIKDNPVAIISTLGSDNELYGAAVYVYAQSPKQLYFVTKTDTKKFQNIRVNNRVAITIVNPLENSSLQAQGRAEVVSDGPTIELVMSRLTDIYARGADLLPPIAKIRAGAYQVVGVVLTQARLAQYKDFSTGDKHIFKEL